MAAIVLAAESRFPIACSSISERTSCNPGSWRSLSSSTSSIFISVATAFRFWALAARAAFSARRCFSSASRWRFWASAVAFSSWTLETESAWLVFSVSALALPSWMLDTESAWLVFSVSALRKAELDVCLGEYLVLLTDEECRGCCRRRQEDDGRRDCPCDRGDRLVALAPAPRALGVGDRPCNDGLGCQEPPQVFGHGGDVGVAPGLVFLEGLQADCFQVGGTFGWSCEGGTGSFLRTWSSVSRAEVP